MTGRSSPQDIAAGALFVTFGAAAFLVSRNWHVGTPAEMGSGFVPQLISGLLLAMGAGILLRGLLSPGERIAVGSLRPLAVVTAGVAAFAATLETLGLVPAVVLTVALSSLAGGRPRIVASILLAAALSLFCVAVFIWGLNLPIRVWPF